MRESPIERARRPSGSRGRLAALATLAGLLWLGLGAGLASAEPVGVNVILITVDTLRPDHLSAYGYSRPTSPNVDAFAHESVVFRRAFSQAPETNPSLSSLMTSHYPHETKVFRNYDQLQGGAVTLAEILRGKGYRTGAVVTNFALRRGSGIEQGFEDYDDRMEDRPTPKWEGIERTSPKATKAAIAWLKEHREEKFFLWVHYMDPHAPYMPPPPYDSMFLYSQRKDPPRPALRLPFLPSGTGTGGIPLYAQLGTHTDPLYYIAQYDGEIRFFDQSLGDLMGYVRAQGLLESTLIVLCADHGEGMGEHNYWFNHPEFIYNPQIRVPLLVRLPGGERKREDIVRPVALLDVFPTILETLSIDVPAGGRGQSLFDAKPQAIFAETSYPGSDPVKTALIANGLKLIVEGESRLLYDMRTDFYETRNLLQQGDAEHRAEAKAMQERIGAILAEDDLHLGPPVQWDLLSESVTKLKALGYVQ